MSDTGHFRKLESMYAAAPVNRWYEPRLRVEHGRAELRMTLDAKYHHAAGAVHGSVYFKALDDAAFFAANSLVTTTFVLTTGFQVHFLRPVVSGEIVATGSVIDAAGSLIVAEAHLRDDGGRLLGHGSGTFFRGKTPLNAAIGYR